MRATLIHQIEIADRSMAFQYETRIHNHFKAIGRWITGEWFNLDEYWISVFCATIYETELEEFIQLQEIAVKRWAGSGLSELRNLQQTLNEARILIAQHEQTIKDLKEQQILLQTRVLHLESEVAMIQVKSEAKITELKSFLREECREKYLAEKERLLREIGELNYKLGQLEKRDD